MNEERFTGLANTYAQYRPSYPSALLSYLYTEAGFSSHSTVADIGAGTGIFSKLLLQKGSAVFCVEPNPDMFAKLQASVAGFANATPVAAGAEHTTLPPASVNFVTAAQAFHWFNPQAFRAECQRILKPGGAVALIWNRRDETSEVVQKLQEANQQYCPGFKGFSGGANLHSPQQFAGFFAGGQYNSRAFPNNSVYTKEQDFIGRSLSGSYAPKPEDANYKPYVEALSALYAANQTAGALTVPGQAVVYWGGV